MKAQLKRHMPVSKAGDRVPLGGRLSLFAPPIQVQRSKNSRSKTSRCPATRAKHLRVSGNYSIGVDVGTQSTKAVVYDCLERTVVGRGAYAYGLLPCDKPGVAEQDPATWEKGMREAIKQATSDLDPSKVSAIGVSGQQHGLVAVDSHDQVIRPSKLWCDLESAAEAELLSQAWGVDMQPAFTATKILWLKNNEPDNFARMEK
ncbi:hypothetical protein CYMTET_28088, partial [Cymbomonas tetramitiformis]